MFFQQIFFPVIGKNFFIRKISFFGQASLRKLLLLRKVEEIFLCMEKSSWVEFLSLSEPQYLT